MRYKRWLPLALLIAAAAAAFALLHTPFPSDHTPEGAYLRIAHSMTDDHVKDIFPYLETDAQWASYTIRDARKKACDRIRASYPEPDRATLLAAYGAERDAPDGSDVFALLAKKRGFSARLRKDLSGVAKVEVEGERASVVTARGTRYPFRRRDNGIWGLTIFTAELLAEADRATRDLAMVEAAATDYDRAKGGAN